MVPETRAHGADRSIPGIRSIGTNALNAPSLFSARAAGSISVVEGVERQRDADHKPNNTGLYRLPKQTSDLRVNEYTP